MKNILLLATLASLFVLSAPRTSAECTNARPELIAPYDRAEDLASPLRFEWSAVPGAVAYRVSIIEEELDVDVAAETLATSASIRLEPGSFGWFVEALFDDCPVTVSEIQIFETAEAANCGNVVPTLLAPAEGAAVSSLVTFSWTPVPGAIAYELSASLDDGEPGFVGETTGTSLTANLGAGHVRWIVDVEFNGCADLESEEGSFEIPRDPACAKSAPLLIAPAYGAVDIPTRVDFVWTPVDGAKRYSVIDMTDDPRTLGTTTGTRLSAHVPAGPIAWAVIAEFDGCPPESTPISRFRASLPGDCATPEAPEVSVAPRASSGEAYQLNFSPANNTAVHEVQEAARADFSDATTWPANDILLPLSHEVSATTRYYYRVRSLSSCGAGAGPWSDTASVVVASADAHPADDADLSAAYGAQRALVGRVRIPGSPSPINFSALADQPWLSVSPRSGSIPPEGLELTVTASVGELPMGTNAATINLTYSSPESSGGTAPVGLPASVPIAINLAGPVSPDAGSKPLPGSLIIPGVAHIDGIGVRFESDVRVLNAAAQTMRYLLSFTLSGTNGTTGGYETTIQVGPGQLAALDDILRNFFGFAGAGDNASGMLEIRPLATSIAGVPAGPGVTFASSRTYAVTETGTLGQYIPAIPFSQFIGASGEASEPPPVLSLQHIAQSGAYRTNVGLVEGSGAAASVLLTIFGDDGKRSAELPIELQPGEHRQLNALLHTQGLTADNGRIEVRVTSTTGRVSAYASVIDNVTGDPMCILPVNPAKAGARRVTLPGIAHIDNALAQWRSEVRLFNAGAADAEVTLTFVPQGSSTTERMTKASVRGGQVLQIDDAVETLFKTTGLGGSVIVTTEGEGKIVATARTFNRMGGGTYGQFIPGIAEYEGAGYGERPLQILQVEESDRFRTNLGIVELTGHPAVVEITVVSPTSLSGSITELSLEPNEYRQLNGFLRQLGLGTTYNARITLRVKSGEGRVGGYASVIDNRTNDPTYVPAQ